MIIARWHIDARFGQKPAVVESLQVSGTGKTVALSFSIPGRVVDMMTPAGPRTLEGQTAH